MYCVSKLHQIPHCTSLGMKPIRGIVFRICQLQSETEIGIYIYIYIYIHIYIQYISTPTSSAVTPSDTTFLHLSGSVLRMPTSMRRRTPVTHWERSPSTQGKIFNSALHILTLTGFWLSLYIIFTATLTHFIVIFFM